MGGDKVKVKLAVASLGAFCKGFGKGEKEGEDKSFPVPPPSLSQNICLKCGTFPPCFSAPIPPFAGRGETAVRMHKEVFP